MKDRQFPFVPKSARLLLAGDYWSIRLRNGRFACGRVLDSWPKGAKGNSAGFWAGLLDWTSDQLPTYDTIAGAKILIEGANHAKSIGEVGGAILGNRPLSLDGIQPGRFLATERDGEVYLFVGLKKLRPASREERRLLSSVPAFGRRYIYERANYEFAEKKSNKTTTENLRGVSPSVSES